MTYFLGKDVDVYWTTEASGLSISGTMNVTDGDSLAAKIGMTSGSTGILVLERNDGIGADTKLTDITGVDFAPGATNEDISYMGQNTNLSAQVKNEFALTLTKKKNDTVWDQLYNGRGRDGAYSTLTTTGVVTADATGSLYTYYVHDGLTTSRMENFGYRLYLVLKDGTEVFVIRNCCLTGHTVSLNADGTQEETAEFYSYVKPLIVSGSTDTVNLVTTMADI
tara:strand:- start:2425 stop:3093 length:669 start_codon:yes stop_codon:yes gene_type:complete